MSRLLDEALPLDVDARQRWLDALAPEYRELATALAEALLPVGKRTVLDQLLAEGAAGHLERIGSGPRAGDLVGSYRLVRLLGEGGMAEVWLAQRADGAFHREVALKLPIVSQLRDDLASRFARECDILAALEHPNIARLYDAGVGTDGLPYLAMEYVAGQPLTEWCDAHALGVRERLTLFRQVLDAVEYAHGRKVIHRDIKPSNILVTESGQVRLLDFGVAKLLATDLAKTSLTQRYGQALTPDYSSPEQMRGEQAGPATDVYALGVVLYELLSGNSPYHLDAGGSMALLQQAIANTVIKLPSANLGPGAGRRRGADDRRLARRLKGDLDAIVQMALAKNPSDRYHSVAALTEDLRRSLGGEPVEARSNYPGYRSAKFLLRHRVGVSTTAAAIALVSAAFGLALIRSRGTPPPTVTHQSLSAAGFIPVAPTDKSIAVMPFIDLSEAKSEEYFSDGLSEALIDHLVHSADLKVIARSSSFQFKDKNEDARSIARQLGVTHLLEGSVRKVDHQMRITAELIRAVDGMHLWSQTYDRNLIDVFKVQDEIGDQVAQAMHVALRSDRVSSDRQPDVRAYNLVLEGNFFKARMTTHDVDKAIELYRQAIQVNPYYALAWARLASALMDQELLEKSPTKEQNRQVLSALDQAIRLDPSLAWAYYTRAGFEGNVKWDWAAAVADTERIRDLDPRFELLPSAIADLALAFGSIDKAIAMYKNAVELDPLDPSTLDALGFALCAANQFESCLQSRLRLLQLHPDFGGVNSSVGIAYLFLGQFTAARQAVQKERNEDQRLVGLAVVYSAMGHHAASQAALRELTVRFATTDAYAIAVVHAYRGEYDEAMDWLDRAFRQHDAGLAVVKADPLLRGLRGNSRYQALLSRMKLLGSSILVDSR